MGEAIRPVILCGGSGARLWPVSTVERPKPFHRLAGRDSLLQDTVRRLSGPGFAAPILVCAASHADLVRRHLEAISVEAAMIVTEATPRGTATAAALGALAAEQLDPDARILIAPADHIVADPAALRRALGEADGLTNRIVLFGAQPDRIETGYGHIRPGPGHGVLAFVEKPDRARAAIMLAEGWLWNTGLFLARADTLLTEIETRAPAVMAAARAAWATAESLSAERQVGGDAVAALKSCSLDRAVIEHTPTLAVVACDMGWRDVGCWQSIWDAGARDTADNQLNGSATVIDSSGCLVWSSGPPVAVVGLTDVVVVSTAAGVLVMPRARAQEVGMLASGMPLSA